MGCGHITNTGATNVTCGWNDNMTLIIGHHLYFLILFFCKTTLIFWAQIWANLRHLGFQNKLFLTAIFAICVILHSVNCYSYFPNISP